MCKMSESTLTITEKTKLVGLKREIGLVSAVNFLLCVIIGSGIFITPGKVLAECGSVGMMLSVWIICGIIAFLTCLPFGELSTVVPKSGGIYIYLHTAFSSYHPFFGDLPAFVYFWIEYVIVEPCGAAVKAILFSDYALVILQLFMSEAVVAANECLLKCTVGATALVLIGVINCVSVKLHVKSQDFLTFIKMAAIMFTIGCGIYLFVSGNGREYHIGFEGTRLSVKGITQALYFGLYAYDGGYAITGITEELKNPEKNILFSIITALSITTATYVLLNLTFLTALTPAEMSSGCTVMSDFAEKLFGPSGGAIAAAIICLCLLTSIMCGIFYSSRLGFVAAREGHMIKILSYIHETQETPAPAVVLQILLSLVYFFAGSDVTPLIDMCSFFAWTIYGFTMMAVFVLRRNLPDAYRPFRVPSPIPVIVAAISCYLVVESLIITDLELLTAFAGCVVLLVAAYYTFIYKSLRFKTIGKLQEKLQNLLMLVPPHEDTKS